MKGIALALFALLPLSLRAAESDPATIVDKFNAAYNSHALDKLMAFFTPESELIEFPDKPLAKGIDAIRKRYEARLAEPNLHADVTNRIMIADKVIDREKIVRTFPEGPGIWEIVTINEVKDGHIVRLWVIVGGKTPTH
jgi:hypothetical protein